MGSSISLPVLTSHGSSAPWWHFFNWCLAADGSHPYFLGPPPRHRNNLQCACDFALDLPKVWIWVVCWRGSYNSTLHSWPVLVRRYTPGGGSGGQGEVGPFDFSLPRSPDQDSEQRFRCLSYGSEILPSRLLALQDPTEASALGRHLEVPLPFRPHFCCPGWAVEHAGLWGESGPSR